jgi:DNA/RNA-binding domain of Phe-tRNA-synthetase-like protein
MHIEHSAHVWAGHPSLVAGAIAADGVTANAHVDHAIVRFTAVADERLNAGPESELPEIQAWRRAYARMGLKPTQYRCAAEALLRRYRKEHRLPRLHPVIDLCNAISMAFAIPVAVFDTECVDDHLDIRHATGHETYLTFDGTTERPDPGEVIFADAGGRAHARRWTNRQSGYSAIRQTTRTVLIVAEALHSSAAADVERLVAVLTGELHRAFTVDTSAATLTASTPRFEF